GPDAQDHGGIVELAHVENLEVVTDAVLPFVIGAHRPGNLAHYGECLIDVHAIAHADVDHRTGEAARAVADELDLAVRHKVHIAVPVAQAHIAQRHFLDQTGRARDFDHVPLADLAF